MVFLEGAEGHLSHNPLSGKVTVRADIRASAERTGTRSQRSYRSPYSQA